MLQRMSWYEMQNLVDFCGAHCPCPRYVIVRYKFDAGVDDTRKEAFRAAAADWRTHTCVAVVEDANAETCRLSRLTIGWDESQAFNMNKYQFTRETL